MVIHKPGGKCGGKTNLGGTVGLGKSVFVLCFCVASGYTCGN